MTQHTDTYHIETVVLAEQPTVAVRASLPTDQIGAWVPAAFEAVLTYLTEAGITPAGPPYARYTFHDDLFAVEAGFPVPAPIPGHGHVIASSLPGGPAARTIHHGPYEHLDAAYHAVTTWLAGQGLQPAGPHWEVYHTDPRIEPDPARWRTDLILPYQSGTAGTHGS
jgi:effector-binding domain-containing protein